MKKAITYIFSCFLLSACCSIEERQLEQALDFAGDNRVELEKVLEHYSNEPEKLEAARFLIRNMPRWYAYEGCQLDSVSRLLALKNRPEQSVNKWKAFSFYSLPKVYDAHVITADYLIENIEQAFDVWKNKPWNRSLGFDDFCEYILPYRIADEPLSSWRKLYCDYFMTILDSTYQGNDVVEACNVVYMNLDNSFQYYVKFAIPHQSATFLFKYRVGYCREYCDYVLYAMRSCGIPVATDFLVHAPDYQGGHSWSAVRDTTGKFLPFYYDEYAAKRDSEWKDGRRKGKIYRHYFGAKKNPMPDIENDIQIPYLFRNPYVKDVTDNYFGKNQLAVPLSVATGEPIYLGVFSPDGWIPIDIGRSDGKKVVFQNVEPNIIYQTFYINRGQQIQTGYPFIYADGKMKEQKPEIGKMEEILLKRKIALRAPIAKLLYRNVIGAKIEVSNSASFAHADLVYQFEDTLKNNYYEFSVPQQGKKYRYLRYSVLPRTQIELAELSAFKDSMCKQKIPLRRVTDIEPIKNLDNITDDDVLTFFIALGNNHTSLVYDLGKPTVISKVVFLPRNDDNFVWPGNVYELFYHDGLNGWKSLGTKTATGHELKYDVPRNALLWLRNRTKGHEEQVFINRNGKQVFVMDLK